MKRPLVPVGVALAVVVLPLAGCSEAFRSPSGPAFPVASRADGPAPAPAFSEACGEPVAVPLLTGRSETLGFVRVENDEEDLVLRLEAGAGLVFAQTDAAVAASPADFPINPQGHAILGQFPLRTKHVPPVSEFVLEVSLDEFDCVAGDSIYVALHALLRCPTDRRGGPSEVWARLFVPADGGMGEQPRMSYFAYVLQPCEPPVVPCALTLVSPVGDEVVCAGYPWEVLWQSTGSCAETVTIELLFDGVVCATLAESAPNTGSFDWEDAQPCAGAPYGYTLRVRDSGGAAEAVSAGAFWIEICGGGE